MPAKPPLYRQETDYSCAPACLRMVLASFGLLKTEQELCALCDCAVWGTDAFKLVEAARKLGFTNTRKYNLTLDELKAELDRGLYPIVYVRAQLAPDTPFQEHAIVVIEMSAKQLLARLRRLHQCEEPALLSDQDDASSVSGTILFKDTPEWKFAYEQVKGALSLREHVPKGAELAKKRHRRALLSRTMERRAGRRK